MKRGQLLSQPFMYIFAIIVIGLLLVFGFRYVGKILETGCEVENIDLVKDVQAQVNQLRALSFGSNFGCTFTKAGGTDYRCEFIVPSGIDKICFVDTTRGQQNQITSEFSDIKNFVELLGSNANRNLFFSTKKGASCEPEPVMIKNLDIPNVLCVDVTKENSFIMENSGNKVQVKMS